MIIMTFKRMTLDGKPLEPDYDVDPNDWWGKIETKEEEIVYEDYLENYRNFQGDQRRVLWNQMVIHAGIPQGLAWGDDDIYGYIRPDETEPEIGEEWTDGDGDTWLRVE